MNKDNIEKEAKDLIRFYKCKDCEGTYEGAMDWCPQEDECEEFKKEVNKTIKELEEECQHLK